ncbi:hypothetical protein R3Q06_27340 [Rhodococcus erythropolis]|uniref:hypothetical protein n=1 Tax=Rhodococcus erythropolis TaxID=1833 RepID=UPI00294928A1|nr:hypothetical protein [Rhodococcus erythropolis]MDV6277214.1 hypothetical protein [Rhodococcus erythropolis]
MSTLKDRHDRMRRWVYIPLVAAIAAGTVCAGTGIGAAETANTSSASDTLQSGANLHWSLFNLTGSPIYGKWEVNDSSNRSSKVEATVDRPWLINGAASADHYYVPAALAIQKWRGRICYHKQWWAFSPPDDVSANQFRLEVDSKDAVHVYYTDTSPILWNVTRNDTLTATGETCVAP